MVYEPFPQFIHFLGNLATRRRCFLLRCPLPSLTDRLSSARVYPPRAVLSALVKSSPISVGAIGFRSCCVGSCSTTVESCHGYESESRGMNLCKRFLSAQVRPAFYSFRCPV